MLSALFASRLIRGGVDAVFHLWARRRTRYLDSLSLSKAQLKTLLHLVRHAVNTRFGRDHDFAVVRTVADYQRRVPLRDYEAFHRDYWRPTFPQLTNVTWPGVVPYLALSSGTTGGATKYIPVTSEMIASNRRAALTSLAWLRSAHRDASLFIGQMFFLGGSTSLVRADPSTQWPLMGDLSGIAVREVPMMLRPFSYPPLDVALMTDWDTKLDHLAEQSVTRPITLISGVPSWLLVLFERLLKATGKQTLKEVWSTLKVIVHGGTRFDPYRSLFRRLAGEGVDFVETYPASEGFVAAEDPRYGLLRLIPDHGVFFEFVPVQELDHDRPTRHILADIVTGVRYAVVLTTCAGLWSYVLGDTICFESRDPPLLRFTGRTKQYLSAFGEHLIGEEVERAITQAATACGVDVIDFHVGPVFPDTPGLPGYHRYFVEFAERIPCEREFARQLDQILSRLNDDYRAHRAGDVMMREPDVVPMPRGGFAEWMRSRGQLGGQHKVPRLDNTGHLTAELMNWHSARFVVPQMGSTSI
jgi:hypothetical protein